VFSTWAAADLSRQRPAAGCPSGQPTPSSGSRTAPGPAGPIGRSASRQARGRCSATAGPPSACTVRRSTTSPGPASACHSPAPICCMGSGCGGRTGASQPVEGA
jgi:hypothetical protein